MSEMVEAVAREIELAEEEWLRREGDAQDGLQEHNDVPLRIVVARAAIGAMRDPTDEMRTALCKACSTDCFAGCALSDVWNAGIDEALKD